MNYLGKVFLLLVLATTAWGTGLPDCQRLLRRIAMRQKLSRGEEAQLARALGGTREAIEMVHLAKLLISANAGANAAHEGVKLLDRIVEDVAAIFAAGRTPRYADLRLIVEKHAGKDVGEYARSQIALALMHLEKSVLFDGPTRLGAADARKNIKETLLNHIESDLAAGPAFKDVKHFEVTTKKDKSNFIEKGENKSRDVLYVQTMGELVAIAHKLVREENAAAKRTGSLLEGWTYEFKDSQEYLVSPDKTMMIEVCLTGHVPKPSKTGEGPHVKIEKLIGDRWVKLNEPIYMIEGWNNFRPELSHMDKFSLDYNRARRALGLTD